MTRRSIRTLFVAGLATALLASCNDESVAGTSDEAQTSLKLQMVADNLRPIPVRGPGGGEAAGGVSVAGRAGFAGWGLNVESACPPPQVSKFATFEEKEDQGMRWRFTQSDDHSMVCRNYSTSREHAGTSNMEWWAEDTLWSEDGQWIEFRGAVQAVTRANFRFRQYWTGTVSQPGFDLDQFVTTYVFDDLGWRATFRWTGWSKTPLALGTPLLQDGKPVGRLAVDTLTDGFRVFDLEGKEYFPRTKNFPPLATDSLGVRVVGIRRDTVDGIGGLRVSLAGHLPADSGLSFDYAELSFFRGPSESQRIFASEDPGLLRAQNLRLWPSGATSANLFFDHIPLGATHIQVNGTLKWERPEDTAKGVAGAFITRFHPIP